jgi:hypothetical protein
LKATQVHGQKIQANGWGVPAIWHNQQVNVIPADADVYGHTVEHLPSKDSVTTHSFALLQ